MSAPRGSAEDRIAAVLDLVGVHARALHALLSVGEVRWNPQVDTACIECRDRPTLHLNPDFVAERCQTPERLAALVLHEMLHVTLGHTRLFPRPTAAHNLAFDAIINRVLLGSLVDAGVDPAPYAALFTEVYAPDAAPAFLLRPPPGWPEAPDWNASAACPAVQRGVHRRLYGDPRTSEGRARLAQLTYADVLATLVRGRDRGDDPDAVPLLGAHGNGTGDDATDRTPGLTGTRDADVMDALGDHWQRLMEVVGGQLPGLGGALQRAHIPVGSRSAPFERAMRAWLRRGIRSGDAPTRRVTWDTRPVQVVHRHEDRRAIVRAHAAAAFGAPAPLWFLGTVQEPRPDPVAVTLYVDVSQSMDRLLPRIRRTLRDLWRELTPTLRWFSTKVTVGTAAELRTGQIPTTGGTAITSVLEHAIRHATAATPVFVLTDGFLEPVRPSLVRRVHAAGLTVHLGVVGAGPSHERESWVTSSTRLPHT